MEMYRGVSIGTDKPVFGFYYNIEDKEHYILQKALFGLFHCEVYKDSVNKCIGLKNKDGIELFQGDIIQFDYSDQKGLKGVISFNKWNHSILLVGDNEYHIENAINGEIIGKVFSK